METEYGILGGTYDRNNGNTQGVAKEELMRSNSRTLRIHRDTVKKVVQVFGGPLDGLITESCFYLLVALKLTKI